MKGVCFVPIYRTTPFMLTVLALTLASEGYASERPLKHDVGGVAATIDREIQAKLGAKGIKPSPRAEDAVFLRRASLDLTGRIPTPERAAEFLASNDPQRRRKL